MSYLYFPIENLIDSYLFTSTSPASFIYDSLNGLGCCKGVKLNFFTMVVLAKLVWILPSITIQYTLYWHGIEISLQVVSPIYTIIFRWISFSLQDNRNFSWRLLLWTKFNFFSFLFLPIQFVQKLLFKSFYINFFLLRSSLFSFFLLDMYFF